MYPYELQRNQKSPYNYNIVTIFSFTRVNKQYVISTRDFRPKS